MTGPSETQAARRVFPAAGWLALIVLFALVVRLWFFVGISYAMDQDEGIYLDLARSAMNGTYRVDFTNRPADYLPNPAEAFQFRYPMIFIPGALFKVVGVNEGTAVAFALACSLGMVVLSYRIARCFTDDKEALLAALCFAICPLDILYNTRLMPDVPLAFFFWLAVYLFVRADREPGRDGFRPTWGRDGRFVAAGLAIGMCYFIKLSTVFIGGVMAVYLVMEWRFRWRYGLVALGFLLMLCAEGFYYAAHGEPFLLNMQINTRVFTQKFMAENPLKLALVPGVFNFWLIDPLQTWYYGREIVASLNPLRPSLLGGFWTVGLVSLPVMVWRRDRWVWIAGAWFAALYLMLEFTPVRLSFNEHGAWINHFLVSQRLRYMTVACVPAAILCAYLIMCMRVVWLRAALMLFLMGTSFFSVRYHRDWHRAGMAALNQAADMLEGLPRRPVYSDHMATGHLYFRSGYTDREYLRQIDEMPEILRDCYVIVGGARGMDMSGIVISRFKDEILKRRDETWIQIAVIPDPARKYYDEYEDLVIYRVP